MNIPECVAKKVTLPSRRSSPFGPNTLLNTRWEVVLSSPLSISSKQEICFRAYRARAIVYDKAGWLAYIPMESY